MTAVHLMLLAKTDIGLIATEGRETVARAAERRAVTKAREAIIFFLLFCYITKGKKEEKVNKNYIFILYFFA